MLVSPLVILFVCFLQCAYVLEMGSHSQKQNVTTSPSLQPLLLPSSLTVSYHYASRLHTLMFVFLLMKTMMQGVLIFKFTSKLFYMETKEMRNVHTHTNTQNSVLRKKIMGSF